MTSLDWIVLSAAMVFIVVYGVWKGRGQRGLEAYLLSGRSAKWYTIALSIMATQASAITFLSTPGQAYDDGMRFVQMYLGLPIAMVILSITAVPIFHRLKVYTAYEYLEGRFDLKTRSAAALLFLTQRGLAAGLTIFAPALILSVILGWNLTYTNVAVGVMVVIYTTLGGTKAVSWTQFHQMLVITLGMAVAFVTAIVLLPEGVGFLDAARLSGSLGRLNAIDFSFDPANRYNIWSGVIGGLFLALSYFGTDQSQVQRYLTGSSIAQSRLALLFNGLVKVPMQFLILLLGAMVFAFYQFSQPPVFFNPVAVEQVRESPYGERFDELEEAYARAFDHKRAEAHDLLAAYDRGDDSLIAASRQDLLDADAEMTQIKRRAVDLMVANDPQVDPSDTNFVFLTFVIDYLPAGLVGLLIAAILFASMSSTSSELNALASTTVVDVYKRWLRPDAGEQHYVVVSKLATVFWGAYAIWFAEFASRLGTLVEAVNILGSIFYGTILGIFLMAFYSRRVGGTAVFVAAIFAELVVVWCFLATDISFLWYNVIGCLLVILFSWTIHPLTRRRRPVAG
ncbi:MAG: sodium:solute symporter [Thermoanaerobaculia bacterium]|nr:sodium:solute symporter [Thermoanaerobaculia bacterium]